MGFLTSLNTMLIDKLGPMGPLLAVGFLGVLLILVTLPVMLGKKPDPLDKLKTQSRAQPVKDGPRLRVASGGAADQKNSLPFWNLRTPRNIRPPSSNCCKPGTARKTQSGCITLPNSPLGSASCWQGWSIR
jgi:hypothetical protein